MSETQLASMFIGSADDTEVLAKRGGGNNLFILDGQTDEVLGHVNKKYVIENEHERDLPTHKDYFRFTVLAENKHAEHLNKRNGLIVPGEDGELLEFRIFETIKYRNNEGLFIEVHALATYLDLKTQKIFDPHKTNAETALQHATIALDGTEWQVGQVDFKGIRTLTFDNPFNSYDYILRIAREFELEPRFYIKVDGNKITGRYVDLIERIGEFRGRTIEFGRDLQKIERKEDTSEVVTALWVYGPEKEDGTRLKVFVEDDEARQRWGRRGQHIIDYYEPQTDDQNITESRLRTLGEMELRKRINAVVTYEAEILDLENVPGMENKKIRFGDTIRIKDTKFNPPLYVEARVFNVKRDVFNKANKTVQLGDYVEYSEDEVKALFKQMQAQIQQKISAVQAEQMIEEYAEPKKVESPTPPPIDPEGDNPIWVDTSKTPHVPHVVIANEWVKISPTEAQEVGAETPQGAQEKAEQAEQNAKSYTDIIKSDLEDGIQQAQTTADGKNSIFPQPTAPSTVGRKIGDVWFDTSRDNLMHRFDGTKWVEAKWGEQSIVANSITANHIKSLVGLNVNNQFVVDSQGNVKFAGNLEGASGTFGKVSVVDGDMTLIDNTTGSETIINTGSNFLFDHSFEFIKPNVALEPVDPNNPYLASICSVDADSLTSYYGGWNNTKPSNARMVRAFDAESKHIYSGLNAIILRGQDYGMWEQICYIPEHVRQTNALSFSAYVAPFEKTTYDLSVSLRIQLVNENGQWIQDLANTSYVIDHTKKYNWQRVSVTYKGNLNIGKNRLRVRLLLNNNTSSAMLLCDGAQLVPFKNPTLYEPESSLFHFLNGIGKAYLISTQHITSDFADVHNLWAGSIEPHTHSTLSLINGWQNFGGGYAPLAVTKNADGMVYLRGLIRNGQTGNYACARLPVGCRPSQREIFAVFTNNRIGRIDITSDGYIWMTNVDSAGVSLSGVSFRAEN